MSRAYDRAPSVRFHSNSPGRRIDPHFNGELPVDNVAPNVRDVGRRCERAAMEIEWPFRASEALDAEALTFRELRHLHRAEYPAVWVPRGVDLTLEQRRGCWLWSGRAGVLSGVCASALLGAKWVDADVPVELVHTNRRPPNGIIVHTDTLRAGEVRRVGGRPSTTPARTAFDLGRRLTIDDGVQRIDALMNATGSCRRRRRGHGGPSPRTWAEAASRDTRARRRWRGIALRVDDTTVVDTAGFPRPETQIKVFDSYGGVFARIDMGWREYCVGVDFEGAQHWTDPRQQVVGRRAIRGVAQARLDRRRLTSGILHNRPQSFLDRVGAALISRGCPKTW